jgi:hypothetical protein
MGDPVVGALVVVLFASSGPSTVARFIPSTIVEPVEGMIGAWSKSHVCKEHDEALEPAVANSNTSPTVAMEHRVVRFCAAVDHSLPNAIFCGLRLTMLGPPATAALSAFCSEVIEDNFLDYIPTVTATGNESSLLCTQWQASHVSGHDQLAIALAGLIW